MADLNRSLRTPARRTIHHTGAIPDFTPSTSTPKRFKSQATVLRATPDYSAEIFANLPFQAIQAISSSDLGLVSGRVDESGWAILVVRSDLFLWNTNRKDDACHHFSLVRHSNPSSYSQAANQITLSLDSDHNVSGVLHVADHGLVTFWPNLSYPESLTYQLELNREEFCTTFTHQAHSSFHLCGTNRGRAFLLITATPDGDPCLRVMLLQRTQGMFSSMFNKLWGSQTPGPISSICVQPHSRFAFVLLENGLQKWELQADQHKLLWQEGLTDAAKEIARTQQRGELLFPAFLDLTLSRNSLYVLLRGTHDSDQYEFYVAIYEITAQKPALRRTILLDLSEGEKMCTRKSLSMVDQSIFLVGEKSVGKIELDGKQQWYNLDDNRIFGAGVFSDSAGLNCRVLSERSGVLTVRFHAHPSLASLALATPLPAKYLPVAPSPMPSPSLVPRPRGRQPLARLPDFDSPDMLEETDHQHGETEMGGKEDEEEGEEKEEKAPLSLVGVTAITGVTAEPAAMLGGNGRLVNASGVEGSSKVMAVVGPMGCRSFTEQELELEHVPVANANVPLIHLRRALLEFSLGRPRAAEQYLEGLDNFDGLVLDVASKLVNALPWVRGRTGGAGMNTLDQLKLKQQHLHTLREFLRAFPKIKLSNETKSKLTEFAELTECAVSFFEFSQAPEIRDRLTNADAYTQAHAAMLQSIMKASVIARQDESCLEQRLLLLHVFIHRVAKLPDLLQSLHNVQEQEARLDPLHVLVANSIFLNVLNTAREFAANNPALYRQGDVFCLWRHLPQVRALAAAQFHRICSKLNDCDNTREKFMYEDADKLSRFILGSIREEIQLRKQGFPADIFRPTTETLEAEFLRQRNATIELFNAFCRSERGRSRFHLDTLIAFAEEFEDFDVLMAYLEPKRDKDPSAWRQTLQQYLERFKQPFYTAMFNYYYTNGHFDKLLHVFDPSLIPYLKNYLSSGPQASLRWIFLLEHQHTAEAAQELKLQAVVQPQHKYTLKKRKHLVSLGKLVELTTPSPRKEQLDGWNDLLFIASRQMDYHEYLRTAGDSPLTEKEMEENEKKIELKATQCINNFLSKTGLAQQEDRALQLVDLWLHSRQERKEEENKRLLTRIIESACNNTAIYDAIQEEMKLSINEEAWQEQVSRTPLFQATRSLALEDPNLSHLISASLDSICAPNSPRSHLFKQIVEFAYTR